MARVIWSPSALADLETLAEYIGRDSMDQASLFVTRVFEKTERLKDYPRSGRVIPELRDQACREVRRAA